MSTRAWAVAIAAVALSAVVSCSSNPPEARKSGTLTSGTAQLTVGDQDFGTTDKVRCDFIQSSTLIVAGDQSSGLEATLSNAGKLSVELVNIHSADGFTGTYDRGVQGTADIVMVGATYRISGVAQGYGAISFAPTTKSFQVRVAC
jgi:ipoprotein LpqH